jgi:hypothetical protein
MVHVEPKLSGSVTCDDQRLSRQSHHPKIEATSSRHWIRKPACQKTCQFQVQRRGSGRAETDQKYTRPWGLAMEAAVVMKLVGLVVDQAAQQRGVGWQVMAR